MGAFEGVLYKPNKTPFEVKIATLLWMALEWIWVKPQWNNWLLFSRFDGHTTCKLTNRSTFTHHSELLKLVLYCLRTYLPALICNGVKLKNVQILLAPFTHFAFFFYHQNDGQLQAFILPASAYPTPTHTIKSIYWFQNRILLSSFLKHFY